MRGLQGTWMSRTRLSRSSRRSYSRDVLTQISRATEESGDRPQKFDEQTIESADERVCVVGELVLFTEQ
ncbi:hypothetical protein PF008_g27034 [Phytophthora fragariae]|uniref:Uncharacterized protein n=1 Tax=Phytophthora fragariae TaxID=53985 RepID=A0A6G0QFB7_9STRA|nr:hypothetical protein PF008_g27034 [Phytophthora fragariae]